MPRLDLVASAGRNNNETINTFNQRANVRSVGLQLTVPIYAGGATTAAVTQAEANAEKAQADLDAATNTVMAELAQDWSRPEGGQLLGILFNELLPKIR